MTKNPEYDYALLRLTKENRPQWVINLGIHSILINGEEIKREFPRLKYKRKFGSYTVIPYMPKNMIEEITSNYKKYFEELLNKNLE
jgi:hypothetical protein